MKTRGLLLAASICLLSAFPLFATGQKEAAKGGGPEVKDITVMTQTNPAFATMSVALEKGWFKQAGFDKVSVLNFTSGNEAGQALISGKLDVWLPGNLPVITMRNNGLPIVIAGNLNYAPAEMLMVRNDAGVKTPADLYKIKIGLVEGSTASAVLYNLAKANGLDMSKMHLVNLPPPEQVTALRNNEIQALICWPPQPLQVKDVATYMFDSTKYSQTEVPIVFGASLLRHDPNTAKAILSVLYRAQAFVIKNPAEAQQIHATATQQPLSLVKEMWPYYWSPGPAYGHMDQTFVDGYNNYTQFLVANGIITKTPAPVLSYIDTSLLKQIDPSYVSVQGEWKP